MNLDDPRLRPGVQTYLALQQAVRLSLRAIRMQELGEWNQARGLLRDAAMLLMGRSRQIPAEQTEARR